MYNVICLWTESYLRSIISTATFADAFVPDWIRPDTAV